MTGVAPHAASCFNTSNAARQPPCFWVEAAIAWKSLDFTPVENMKYRGDIGVTHGNEAGTRTSLRTYWSNQETGLVNDAVFEVKPVPKDWGTVVIQK
jgi:hypothetical protein